MHYNKDSDRSFDFDLMKLLKNQDWNYLLIFIEFWYFYEADRYSFEIV